MMYWGKGLRPLLATPEYACLDLSRHDASAGRRALSAGRKNDAGVHRHHASLNGHSQDRSKPILRIWTPRRGQRGFGGVPPQRVDERRRGRGRCWLLRIIRRRSFWPDLRSAPRNGSAVKAPPKRARCATSAPTWLSGVVLEQALPARRSSSFTGSGSCAALFPESMPIFYMFSVRHGTSDKPVVPAAGFYRSGRRRTTPTWGCCTRPDGSFRFIRTSAHGRLQLTPRG